MYAYLQPLPRYDVFRLYPDVSVCICSQGLDTVRNGRNTLSHNVSGPSLRYGLDTVRYVVSQDTKEYAKIHADRYMRIRKIRGLCNEYGLDTV